MGVWSLTRFPEGSEPEKPTPPEPWESNDPRWPPIPTQDFSNLPRQQRGLHAKGFAFMRLSAGLEGHISNFERTIDGFLAGLAHDKHRELVVSGIPVIWTDILSTSRRRCIRDDGTGVSPVSGRERTLSAATGDGLVLDLLSGPCHRRSTRRAVT